MVGSSSFDFSVGNNSTTSFIVDNGKKPVWVTFSSLVKGTSGENTEVSDTVERGIPGSGVLWNVEGTANLVADSVVLKTIWGWILVLNSSTGK